MSTQCETVINRDEIVMPLRQPKTWKNPRWRWNYNWTSEGKRLSNSWSLRSSSTPSSSLRDLRRHGVKTWSFYLSKREIKPFWKVIDTSCCRAMPTSCFQGSSRIVLRNDLTSFDPRASRASEWIWHYRLHSDSAVECYKRAISPFV